MIFTHKNRRKQHLQIEIGVCAEMRTWGEQSNQNLVARLLTKQRQEPGASRVIRTL
jgi:hypothetical protein